ncbi:MAG: peptide ABC transporter substrate-binding protein [Bdellovibrionales bacterium]
MLFRILCLVLSFAILNSCTKKETKSDPNTFVFRVASEPPNIDPAKGVDTVSIDLMNNLGEGLLHFDKDMRPVPALAESYEVSRDGLTLKFKIRSGVVWSDDVPLKAQHFVESWERLLRPTTAGEYAYFLFDIKNAEEYNSGKIKDFAQVGVKALDDQNLEVQLRSPASYWLNMVAFVVTYPVRVDLEKKVGDKFMDPANFVGIGPYKLVEWAHDNKLVLERNEKYWGKKPAIKTVVALIVEDASTAMSLFEKGRIDFMRRIPSLQIEQVKNDPQFHNRTYLRGYHFGFNIKKKPVDNVKVRKALAHAIDREEIVKILKDGRIPTTSWIPDGLFAFNKDIGLKFDPEKAKKLLAEAGYPDGKGFPRMSVVYDVREDNKTVVEALQGMWKKHLNIEVELSSQEWKVYLESLRADAAPVFRFGWGADFPDPHNFMDMFLSKSGNNHTKFASKKYDDLIRQGSTEQDPKKRALIYDQAQRILLEEEVAIVPVFQEGLNYLLNKRVKDFHIDAISNLFIQDFRIE